MVVDFDMTDLLCMRLCVELSHAQRNPRRCKAEVGLSILSRKAPGGGKGHGTAFPPPVSPISIIE